MAPSEMQLHDFFANYFIQKFGKIVEMDQVEYKYR